MYQYTRNNFKIKKKYTDTFIASHGLGLIFMCLYRSNMGNTTNNKNIIVINIQIPMPLTKYILNHAQIVPKTYSIALKSLKVRSTFIKKSVSHNNRCRKSPVPKITEYNKFWRFFSI
jgi:hypothetical protein